MDRRQALGRLGGAALAAACVGPAEAASEGSSYEVVTEIDVARKDVPASLFIPLIESVGAWQRAGAAKIACDRPARIVRDRRYGAAMVRVDFGEGEGSRRVRIAQTVTTRDRTLQPARLSPEERAFWTAALPSLPVDGIVLDTARRAAAGAETPRAKARAIYDWVVDHTFRDAAVRGCGLGGVEAMLRTGYLGGKCADINSLMVALCRAAGLPARDVYGVRIGPSRILPCLGLKSSDATRGQHCRAEVHIAGEGWLPVDPADVRKVVLETKAPVDSDLVRAQRERLFGAWEMNWAAYNSATDLDPPGAPRPPAEHFLMYPMALWPGGEADQLDPDGFRYTIIATAL
jgi:transglutaminase-like putative cysteine protease